MKCIYCKIGDLHLSDEIWKFNWKRFWKKPKTVGYIFICDNCSKEKIVYIEGEKK